MIKVALTNLGKYNEGKLCYEWVDLPAYEEEIEDVLERIGIDGERYEEYFITDYDDYEELSLGLGEYENLEKLNDLAGEYDSLRAYEQEAVKLFIEAYKVQYSSPKGVQLLELALEHYKDIIYIKADSLGDLARMEWEETHNWDECSKDLKELIYYVDWERYAKDYYHEWTEVTDGFVLLNY